MPATSGAGYLLKPAINFFSDSGAENAPRGKGFELPDLFRAAQNTPCRYFEVTKSARRDGFPLAEANRAPACHGLQNIMYVKIEGSGGITCMPGPAK